ncbi:hypothetical protein LRR81_01380 [Metabacillus sp. GX 13764]|uniref:hypothetical protein n=1 Tax=Metabacillus kandeliae TaxID=2900151 RepID=UPI001E572F1E|nr:hypothetical protein [Metabacillus kandeliae]MCD7032862.1 hypothetical protein [Metabacillus kandeliae]
MKKLVGILAILIFMFSNSLDASAHSGRTDRLGGHFRTANCTYMFHHPTSAVRGKTKTQIVSLIKRYNSNTKCTRTLTIKKVNWNTVKHK